MSVNNIRESITYDGIKKTELYKNEHFHIMQLCLQKNEFLKPHYAKTDAFLLVQEGQIIFYRESEVFFLQQGDVLSFTSTEKHAVKALSNASLLLVK